jgi:hypothetical protein
MIKIRDEDEDEKEKEKEKELWFLLVRSNLEETIKTYKE